MEFYDTKMEMMDDDCQDIAFIVFIFGIGICLFVSFQIPFFCLITPFILICLVYRKFYYSLALFFGIGENF